MPPISRVSSSSLILAFDSKILVYHNPGGKLINSISIPDIQSKNGSDGKDASNTKKMPGKGTCEPLEIIAFRLSPDGSLCCVADSHKRLFVYETASWKLTKELATERKVSLITFDSTGKRILLADRTGDVYLADMSDGETETSVTLLMGHLSIILALEMTPDDRFVVTADRDEKIRISHFPNSYNIQSYCLGHREFVSSLVVLDDERLISGSGDGTIRMWMLHEGKLITSMDCGADHNIKQIVKVSSQLIAVSFYAMKLVKLYCLTDDQKIMQQQVIDVSEEVLSMERMDQDSLILLTRSSEQPFLLITLSSSESVGSEAGMQAHDSLLKSINSLDELRQGMKQRGAGSDAEDLKLLKKEAYDNVNEYLLRKQERLEKKDDVRSHKRTRLNQSPSSSKDQPPLVIPKLE